MSLLLHIIVTYIKENIITKLQKFYSLPRNPRAGNKSPDEKTSLHGQFITHAHNINWKACLEVLIPNADYLNLFPLHSVAFWQFLGFWVWCSFRYIYTQEILQNLTLFSHFYGKEEIEENKSINQYLCTYYKDGPLCSFICSFDFASNFD